MISEAHHTAEEVEAVTEQSALAEALCEETGEEAGQQAVEEDSSAAIADTQGEAELESQSESQSESQEAQTASDSAPALPLPALLAGVLFVATKPLTSETLSEVTGADSSAVEAALEEVQYMFSEQSHGFSLCAVGGGFQLRTSPGIAAAVKKLYPPKIRRLSRAAAETLAVIAYKQPVQRAEIEAIRGVDALPTLKTLVEQKLIRVVGHEDVVGQPALYGTTPVFLERFGLKDLAELPTIRELEQFDEEIGEVADESEAPEDAQSLES